MSRKKQPEPTYIVIYESDNIEESKKKLKKIIHDIVLQRLLDKYNPQNNTSETSGIKKDGRQ